MRERLDHGWKKRESDTNGLGRASEVLREWRADRVFGADELVDPCRLHGCSEDELLAVLTPGNAGRIDDVPGWLADLIEAYAEDNQPGAMRIAPHWGGDTAPFLRTFAMPLTRAFSMMRSRCKEQLLRSRQAGEPLDPHVLPGMLFPGLAPRLGHMVGSVLALELREARARGDLSGDTPEERFDYFISGFESDGACLDLFCAYPVLARTGAELIADWAAAGLEFAARLVADLPSLAAAFGCISEADELIGVDFVGDFHCRGRAVLVAKFRSGGKVVYKPRPVDTDAHFQELLVWLNQQHVVPELKPIQVLPRDGYGWVEFIADGHCDSMGEVRRFFERQGAYLAVLHLLAGVDVHSENVIAAGEQPMLVDLETLFHPVMPFDEDGFDYRESAYYALAQNVLRVGLLPQRIVGADAGHSVDPSGLGGGAGNVMPFRSRAWRNVGRDDMRLELEMPSVPPTKNQPILAGRSPHPANFVPELLRGFRRAHEALCREADVLLAPNGLIGCFSQDTTRCLLRPSTHYGLLLETSFHPDFLTDAIDRERRFDRLLGGTTGWKHDVVVCAAEREDLWHEDVPVFRTRPESTVLESWQGSKVEGFFPASGMAFARDHFASDYRRDGRLQEWIIEASVKVDAFNDAVPSHSRAGLPEPRPRARETAALMDQAERIGSRLAELAFIGSADATWMTVSAGGGRNWTLRAMGPDLYSGTSGVALFLAYLGEVTGKSVFTDLAKQSLRTMWTQVTRWGDDLEIGVFSGLAGCVYVLTHAASLWDDPGLVVRAHTLVDRIASEVRRDEAFDFVSGAAGALRALLVLDAAFPSKAAVSTATMCGEHLLASAVETANGIGWLSNPGDGSKPLTGLAHGNAGIAWALFELAARTKDGRFRDAALAAITYERSLFNLDVGNWPDLRKSDFRVGLGLDVGASRYMYHWCHGSAGIGLARLRTMEHCDDSRLSGEVQDAIRATLSAGFGLCHCLCHGDLGNLELVNQGHRLFKAIPGEWRELSARVATSIETNGWITGHPAGVESPDLMLGLAGIGYGLLRLAVPESVPSVLTLDAPTTLSSGD